MKRIYVDYRKINELDDKSLLNIQDVLNNGSVGLGNDPKFPLHEFILYKLLDGRYELDIDDKHASSIMSERSFLEDTNIKEILGWTKSMIEQNLDDDKILTKYGYKKVALISYKRKFNDQQEMTVARLKDNSIRFHLLGGRRLLETSVFPFPHMEMAVIHTERKYFKLENIAYMNQELRDGLLKNENTNQ